MPDTVNVEDILSIDVTPLASGAHATSRPDMSVAASKSVDPGTSMSVDFDDHMREIQNTSLASSFADALGAYSFRNSSFVCSLLYSRIHVLLHIFKLTCKEATQIGAACRNVGGWLPF